MEYDNIFEKLRYLSENEKEEELKIQEDLRYCYFAIEDQLRKYLVMSEENYKIISLWIIGTWLHDRFPSFPYLYINAMRGSGKTRLLKIISSLSKQGNLLNSLTEATLFRTEGTLCIDEFEGIGRKGSENLRELLNSAYKKGTKVRRMKKSFENKEERQIVEEFNVYRPIAIANIWGIDDVLGDRCIKINLEKSTDQTRTMLIEDFDENPYFLDIKKKLHSISTSRCSLCGVVLMNKVLLGWNEHVLQQDTTLYYTTTLHTFPTLTTLLHKFELIKNSKINGRDLEISFPILLLSILMSDPNLNFNIFEEILQILTEISNNKKQEEVIENYDISLFDFVSQEPEEENFIQVKKITEKFKEFLQVNEEWLNNRWMGRALKRLNLIKEKRRVGRGVEVILNYKKAQEKMLMFK